MDIFHHLSAEVDVLDRELDEGQRLIDHAKKTFFGKLPIYKAALDRRQHILDAQRIRVNAAKDYLANQK